jgi:bacteriocin-like protein
MMADQNQTQEDAKTLNTPQTDVAAKVAEESAKKDELTDEELTAVVGGILLPVFAQAR